LSILRIINKPYNSNTYLVYNEYDRHCVIIDPGFNEIDVEKKIGELKLLPKAVFLTHGHFDHVSGASFLKNKYNVTLYINKNDIKLYKSANFYAKICKVQRFINIVEPDVLLIKRKYAIKICNLFFNIINLPGHTDGSCVIKYEDNIFTGDTLYRDGVYLNKFPGQNTDLLKSSISEIFSTFNKNVICYPGHGDSASLSEIIETNNELKNYLNY
jgi:hydroxyacylglutathione hydrolase